MALAVGGTLNKNTSTKYNLLGLLYVMFSCIFVTFPCGVQGQVWHLIEFILDFCFFPYSEITTCTVDSQKLQCRSGSAGFFISSRSGSTLPSYTLYVQSIDRNYSVDLDG